MKEKATIFEIFDKIRKQPPAEIYNTGLAGEELIVKSYKLMNVKQLESLRFIINKIIAHKKKEDELKHNTANSGLSDMPKNK